MTKRSFLGTNIKKIRIVKKLNQKEFAAIFDLTRSAVGSYEEGRAEPKIDKVIEISEYFKIPLDKLLKKKLTVNDILNYNPSKLLEEKFLEIPFVPARKINKYLRGVENQNLTEKLQKIVLPYEKFFGKIAFEIEIPKDFWNGTVAVCQKPTREEGYFLGLDFNNVKILSSPKGKFIEIWQINHLIISDLSKVYATSAIKMTEQNIREIKLTLNRLKELIT